MYFPYLRGKQFELETLLESPSKVFSNTIPIVEPVGLSQKKYFKRIAENGIPLILVVNPYHPHNNSLSLSEVQSMIDGELTAHRSLTLGYLIDQRFNITDLNLFLATNPNKKKAVIFRFSPLPSDLANIQKAISKHPVEFLIFDERKTSPPTRDAFLSHNKRVLLTDGFQKQEKNANYPPVSSFYSAYDTWKVNAWAGTGDYLTIGDNFSEGGGQVYVITLHVTIKNSSGLEIHHFSSAVHSTTKGLPAPKFAQANGFLVSSSHVKALASKGVELYRDWYKRKHNPQLGAAKKASMMHHIELLSSII